MFLIKTFYKIYFYYLLLFAFLFMEINNQEEKVFNNDEIDIGQLLKICISNFDPNFQFYSSINFFIS